MSHRLEPHPGKPYLDPDEVIDRLRAEFDDVQADRDEGEDGAGDLIAKLLELDAPQAIIDDAIARRDESYRVSIADGMTSEESLSFLVQRDEGPLIGYSSAEHEKALAPLVARCAAALNYRIELL